MQNTVTVAALCAVGAERVVSNELRKLGLTILDTGFGKVRFSADVSGIYRALMALRAADRLLLETTFFEAMDFDALFDGVKAVPWEDMVPRGMGLRVTKVRSNRSRLKAATSIQAIVHKAAAERLCAAHGIRRLPEGEKTAEIRVYVEKDQVSLLLDLSGDPLFKRGYRSEGGAAPLRETTAAAILLLAGWRRKFPLYDPFCGSGTIIIEAAMYAWDMAPGLGRPFALQDLCIADPAAETAVRAELLGKVNFDHTIRIYGSDADSRAVSIAKSNALRAWELACGKVPQRGVRLDAEAPTRAMTGPGGAAAGSALPEIKALPMKDAHAPASPQSGEKGRAEKGFILTNPPYGKRLGSPGEAEEIYGEMAGLCRSFPGWKLALITDHPGFESFFGKKADSCREITNGAISSYFFQYEGL
ncbi:RNA methyltransferase [Spirochaetia bacterium]|nr:RNA methyltransferase [Spirochaetia bacterium]